MLSAGTVDTETAMFEAMNIEMFPWVKLQTGLVTFYNAQVALDNTHMSIHSEESLRRKILSQVNSQ